nr:putative reverse transcriptase domain-containing protein [Tanacetum cinerariifolium]
KGVVRFGKRGKLNPRYVRPYKVLAKVGKVSYKLELPQELCRVHHTFHVSNLKKCYADEPLVMPLEGIHVDDRLQFVEEPVEFMEREIKRLKRSRIPLVKVYWNSRRGPEFTWEREDLFRKNTHISSKNVVYSKVLSFKDKALLMGEDRNISQFQVESSTDCIESLKKELEVIKNEKECLESKLTGFKSATKDLDHLIRSQRSDKIKEGLGYSAV